MEEEKLTATAQQTQNNNWHQFVVFNKECLAPDKILILSILNKINFTTTPPKDTLSLEEFIDAILSNKGILSSNTFNELCIIYQWLENLIEIKPEAMGLYFLTG